MVLASEIFSINTTIAGNSFKISSSEANDIVNKTPTTAVAVPVDPIGKERQDSVTFYFSPFFQSIKFIFLGPAKTNLNYRGFDITNVTLL